MSLIRRLREFLTGESQSRPSFGRLEAEATRQPRVERRPTPEAESRVEAIEPTEEFGLVRALLEQDSPFVVVTGQAGTGKTTCIRWICEQRPGNVAVVAPTGLAALTAGGQTIHSFFGFPPRWVEPEDIKRRHDPAIFQALDLLVIDEISMVRADLLDAMDRFLRINRSQRKPSNAELPFGGVQVLALGDLFQLPPVVPSDDQRRLRREGYASPHFFSAKALAAVVPAMVELTRPFRQRDEEFLGLLRRIREEKEVEGAIAALNERCHRAGWNVETWLFVVPTRQRAETINTQRLAQLPGGNRCYRGVLEGQFLSGGKQHRAPTDDQTERNLPAPYELHLKPGARVIFTKNDAGHRWVNGTMGTVLALGEDGISIQLDGGDKVETVHVTPVRWKKERYVFNEGSERIELKEIGAYTQLPVAPAWAITIHKVQGQTLDRICVDLDTGAFAAGQTYVAISRCRSMEGLRLKRPITRDDVCCDQQIRQFMEAVRPSLANWLLERDETFEQKRRGDDRSSD